MIRNARADELPMLREIETAAGAVFREIGMHEIADDEPPTTAELAAFQADGRAWVAVDATDRPVGYLLASLVDGDAHIDQVSVHPDHARQGLGRALIEVVVGWARGRGLPGVTLTSFARVPWNAPYYERLGFHVLPDEQLTSGLRAIRDEESARGLDSWPRVAMRRVVTDLPR
ncbi:GNAT superfamily N-acetyltransferase [Actinopolyspora lacussalsi]|nr:GNAT superfamily N-acetyltransferase [Actinopolyspora lacussalsi]